MMTYPISLISVLILFSNLGRGTFPSGLLTKNIYAWLNCSICTACPDYLRLLEFITVMIYGDEYKLLGSFLIVFSILLLSVFLLRKYYALTL